MTHPTITPKTERNAEIVQQRAAGAKLAEIGQRYGITRQRVCQILAAARRSTPTSSPGPPSA